MEPTTLIPMDSKCLKEELIGEKAGPLVSMNLDIKTFPQTTSQLAMQFRFGIKLAPVNTV